MVITPIGALAVEAAVVMDAVVAVLNAVVLNVEVAIRDVVMYIVVISVDNGEVVDDVASAVVAVAVVADEVIVVDVDVVVMIEGGVTAANAEVTADVVNKSVSIVVSYL